MFCHTFFLVLAALRSRVVPVREELEVEKIHKKSVAEKILEPRE
jgi:hypothetical protein